MSESPEPAERRPRFIKDPIHDLILISSLACQIIDTPHFQRLRSIKQLGTSYFVWPGGSHNRFEHSLGVYHLARTQAEILRKEQPELEITDRDIECVSIAGLCHDLGHGPWSHVWDNMFMPRAQPNSTWTHEDGSAFMFDDLLKRFPKVQMSKKDVQFVKALILGDCKRAAPDEKLFLFDIVANKRNGLDVDKFDYICRDSHQMMGKSTYENIQMFMLLARVIDNQIAYNIKNQDIVFKVFQARYELHKTMYNHKTAKAIEHMLIDMLLLADPHLHFSSHVKDSKKYLYLTDDIITRIEMSESDELQPARDLALQIRTRDLYRQVEHHILAYAEKDKFREAITPKRIADHVNQNNPDVNVKESDIIVDVSVIHHGMKDKNPLELVKFYSWNDKKTAFPYDKSIHSLILPSCFAEVMVRVYTKDQAAFGHVSCAYKEVFSKVAANPDVFDIDTDSDDTLDVTVPTTPKLQSRKLSGRSSRASLGKTSSTGSIGSYTNVHTTVPPSYSPGSKRKFSGPPSTREAKRERK